MNEHEEDRVLRQRFGRVLEGLRRLSDAIDRKRYPGTAWTGPERLARREAPRRTVLLHIGWPLAAAVAAAAVIVVAVGLLRPGRTPGTPPQQVASLGQTGVRTTASDIDLSLAGMLTMELPELALWPAEEEAGGLDWIAPNGTAPASDEYREPRRNKSQPPES